MPAAPLHPRETERLAALHRLGILDSPPDQEFDALVRAAALACGKPLAFLSLVDADRQWFKANVGMGGVTETPREVSVCAHTILRDDLLEIADMATDPLTRDDPAGTARELRFYAGVPLRLRDGNPVGALCVAGRDPGQLDDAQREILRSLGVAAAAALEAWHAAQGLKASEDRLRRLYRGTPAMLQSVDPDGLLLDVSDTWLRKLGFAREEVVGRPFRDFVTPSSRDRVAATFAAFVEAGWAEGNRHQMVCRDGTVIDVSVSAVLERQEDGRPWRGMTVLEDVTLRLRAERALAAERLRLSNLIDADGTGTWEWNVRTGVVHVNARWAAIVGLAPMERDKSIEAWLGRLHPDDAVGVRASLDGHLGGAAARFEVEARVLHEDGHYVWVLDRGGVVTRDAAGEPHWMFGTRMDITARKLQEEARRKNEDFLDRAGRLAGVGGWELDLLTRELTWSAETKRIHGVPPEYVPALESAIAFYPPEARPIISLAVERSAAGGPGWDLELPLVSADGRRLWVRAVGSATFADGQAVRLTGAFQDITEQVARREALQRANERVTLATASGGIGIWDWDLVTDRKTWDAQMYRLHGLEPRDVERGFEDWRDCLHSEDVGRFEHTMREALAGGTPFDDEFRVLWPDGSIHHLRACGEVTLGDAGKAVRMVGVNWDVTEERRLAAELVLQAQREAEAAELESALFRNSPDVLYVIGVRGSLDDPEFVYEALSPSTASMTGFRAEDIIGRPLDECFPPPVVAAAVERYRRCIAEATTISYSQSFEAFGAIRDIEGSITPVRSAATGQITRLVGSLRVVTERNRMQAALHQDQKMNAIGRLAAGVAHDFNNILQSITAGLELVQDELVESTPATKFVAIGLRAARRGSYLTHHLLSYARKQMLRPLLIDVGALLADVAALLDRTLGKHVAVTVRVHGAPPFVSADPGQLQTALLNLGINASHAMPDGGSLVLEATEYRTDADLPWVVIAVTDTGTGMDDATQRQAIEPFFTTKGSLGTGLGLSMVHGFAEQSGGRMRIDSALGRGTRVELHLPAATDHATRTDAPVPSRTPAKARILLVDDDTDVLVTTGAFLEKAGFSIVRATNGAEALAVLSEPARVDALVTDYAMSGINGADLIARARIGRPALPAVLISGFVDVVDTISIGDRTVTMHKPFQRQELIEAVWAVLSNERRLADAQCSHRPLHDHA